MARTLARVCALLAALSVLPAVPPVLAADVAADGLDDYRVTRWERAHGAPGGLVVAMVQDRDGYLWLGSGEGLFRFDGFTFQRWADLSSTPLAGVSVRSLFVDRGGLLWAGFEEGGVSQIRGTQVRNFTASNGLTDASVRVFAQDSAGTLWIGTLSGLYSLAGDRWAAYPAANGLPAGAVLSALTDATGSFFVGTPDAVFRRRAGSSSFERMVTRAVGSGTSQALCKDADGHIVTTDPLRGFRILEGTTEYAPDGISGFGLRVACARNGTIWVGTRLTGLWRVASGAHARPLQVRTGLLSQAALSLLEDRDQNIWVATSGGVFRLTPRNVRTLPGGNVATSVTTGAAGDMWVGTVNGLQRLERQGTTWRTAASYLEGRQIRSVHADARGVLWVASSDGVMRVEPGGAPAAPPWGPTFRQVTSITSNAGGTLWLYDERQGLQRLRGDRLEPIALDADLRGVSTTVLHADRRGRLWLVSARGVELRGDDGEVRRYTVTDGLDEADYRSIYEDQAGVVWLGSTSGLSRLIDGRIESVRIAGVGRTIWVKAIVEDRQGQLWLGLDRGGISVSRASFQDALRSPQRLLADGFEVFDGLPGTIRNITDRVAARTATGQLWFVTDEGIAIVDPDTTLPDLGLVPARITRARADESLVDSAQPAELAAGTRRVQIGWTALDLTAPDRVRFRYRLDGVDREWRDAGGAREAEYSDLQPGAYVFRVMAAREGDSWTDNGTAWEFSVAPRFYQAFWFPFLAAAALAGMAWVTWHIRLVQIRRRFSITLHERARVSREVHDTLLQSLVGVSLQCQALAEGVEAPVVRDKLVHLRKRVDEHIGEARELIWNLRSPTLERYDLVTALHRTAQDAVEGTLVKIEYTTHGEVRTCLPRVERELLKIGGEAISNAVRHGRPSLLEIALHFEGDTVRLRVVDNGCGFSPTHTIAVADRHCGLLMMRERAEELGGRFSIDSIPAQGTRIEAIVPLEPAEAV